MAKRTQTVTDSANVPNRGTASVPRPTPSKQGVTRSTNILLFATIADTTWRLFVPVFVLLGIGLYIDNKQGHKPILGLIGAITGALIGFLLVRQQYRQITQKEDK